MDNRAMEEPDPGFLEESNSQIPINSVAPIPGERGLRRYLTHLLFVGVIAAGAWVTRSGLTPQISASNADPASIVASAPEAIEPPSSISIDRLPDLGGAGEGGSLIPRTSNLHTIFPSRTRVDIQLYEVQAGDSLFGISAKFGVAPETILWGNFDILEDNPHSLRPGQNLKILPTDGALHNWTAGEGLIGVADFFNVPPEDIVDWPGNNLAVDIDLQNPDISPGTPLVIPGGTREFVSWSAPRISRTNPSSASILGPGACGSIYDGPLGTGTFLWPAPARYLSGFDYSPGTNHYGIDIAGDTGHSIFSADNGVVVYSGWHNGGYGNVIVIDHGNGWQSLYAHLSQTVVACGDGVFQGTTIGAMGSTGNSTGSHLHFEMLSEEYGKVNPWNFLS
jgi:LysM repeat protein